VAIWVPYAHEVKGKNSDGSAPNKPVDSGEDLGTGSHQETPRDVANADEFEVDPRSQEHESLDPIEAIPNSPHDDDQADHSGKSRTARSRAAGKSRSSGKGGSTTIDVGLLISDSWQVYTEQMVPLLFGPLLVMLLLIPAIFLLVGGLFCCAAGILGNISPDLGGFGILLGFGFMIPFFAVTGAISEIGNHHTQLRALRGEKVTIGDSFYGFGSGSRFIWRMAGMFVLPMLAILLTCGIATPAVMLLWPFSRILFFEDLSIQDSFEKGWKLMTERFVDVLLVGLIGYAMSAVAGISIIGWFIIPLIGLIFTLGYLRLSGEDPMIYRAAYESGDDEETWEATEMS